ncbi:MAG: hypothetical protein ACOC6F_01555 [bacterium]
MVSGLGVELFLLNPIGFVGSDNQDIDRSANRLRPRLESDCVNGPPDGKCAEVNCILKGEELPGDLIVWEALVNLTLLIESGNGLYQAGKYVVTAAPVCSLLTWGGR